MKLILTVERQQINGLCGVRFSVRDNGVGISEEVLPKVFSLGLTTRKKGHGFGLHSAANAAQEMGGSLIATSDGPGLDACFTLTVPVQMPQVFESPTLSRQQAEGPNPLALTLRVDTLLLDSGSDYARARTCG